MTGRRRKLRPVPPGCSVRTVLWNRLVRELLADLVRSNSGNFSQIHPVVRVRKFSTRDLYSDYGHWHRRSVPAFGLELGRRDRVATGLDFARCLHRPTLMQVYAIHRAR